MLRALLLVALLLLPTHTWAAVSVITSGGGASTLGDTSFAETASLDTTGATFLALGCVWYDFFTADATIVDSKSNTWTALTHRLKVAENGSVQWWYVNSATPTVGSGHTFRCTVSNGFPLIGAIAASGLQSSPLDVENTSQTNGATSLQAGSASPTTSAGLILQSIQWMDNVTSASIDGSYSTIYQNENPTPGASVRGGFYYLIHAGSASAPTWNWTTSRPAISASEVFKAPVVAGNQSLSLLGVGP